MHSKSITPATPPARAGLVQTVLDSLGDLYRLIQQGAAEPDTRRVYERYQLAVPAAIVLAAKSIPKENGAPRGGDDRVPEAAPNAGDLAVTGGTCGERGIRTPDTLAGTPDFESGTSPRAAQLAALAWDLVDRDPQLAARVAFDLVELDEHDPVACIAECCNSPLALEVRS